MEKVGEDKEMVVASYNYSTDHNMPLNYPVDKRFPLGDPSFGGSIVFNLWVFSIGYNVNKGG